MLARGEHRAVVLHLRQGASWPCGSPTVPPTTPIRVRAARVSLAEGGLSPFPLEATTDAQGKRAPRPDRAGPGDPVRARRRLRRARGRTGRRSPPARDAGSRWCAPARSTGRVVDARGYPVDGATIEIVGTDPAGRAHLRQSRGGRPSRAPTSTRCSGARRHGARPASSASCRGPCRPSPTRARAARVGPHRRVAPAQSACGAVGDARRRDVPREPGLARSRPRRRSPSAVRRGAERPRHARARRRGPRRRRDARGRHARGQGVDARDRPVEGARVVVSATRGSLERTTRTASDGTFAFASMPDEVRADRERGRGRRPARRAHGREHPRGRRKEVVVHLPAARDPLPVSVTDARGRPVDAAQVSASSLVVDAPLRTTDVHRARWQTPSSGPAASRCGSRSARPGSPRAW